MSMRSVCVLCILCIFGAGAPALAGDGPDLRVTPIPRDGQVYVSFELSDGFSPDVKDAIQSGLPTTFSYEIELRQSNALLDRTLASLTIDASVRFDNLTRRYHMSRSVDGRVDDARPTEDSDAVRDWLTRFDRVPISTTAALEPNAEYYVRVRALARPRSSWFAGVLGRGAVLGNAKFTFLP